MGLSSFLPLLLASMLLVSFFSYGCGSMITETVEVEDFTRQVEETAGNSRQMFEVMDYGEPKPNTNPNTGYIITPPPQP